MDGEFNNRFADNEFVASRMEKVLNGADNNSIKQEFVTPLIRSEWVSLAVKEYQC